MFKPKFTITNSIANTLTTIERARGFLEAATLSEEDRYAIARAVVDKLRERGDPWGLEGELPPFFHRPPTQGYR